VRSNSPDIEALEKLLPGVPAGAISDLAASAREAVYERGETVLLAGVDTVPGVVAAGRLRLSVRAADGREAMLRTLRPGSMFGLVRLFDAERSVVKAERSIVAVDRSTVFLLDPETLLRIGPQMAPLAWHLARHLADTAAVLGDVAGQFAFLSVRQRLAAHLVTATEMDTAGRNVAFVTQQELANAIGTVREVVARTLHDLRQKDIVRVAPGRVEVVDTARLLEIARADT
jgi:CRP/FNR family transcriptional regulator